MANATLDPYTRAMLTGRLTTVVLVWIYIAVFAIGLPAHATALWVFSFKRRARTASNVYMINLAAADLLYILALPLQIAYHFRGNDWPFGRPLCHVLTLLLYTNTHCSIFFLTCIGVDRYGAIVWPLHTRHMHGARHAWAVAAGVWALTLLMLAPVQSVRLTKFVEELNITTCYDVFPRGEGIVMFFLVYCVVFVAVNFLVPVGVTAFCYVSVIRTLARAGRRARSEGNCDHDIRKGIRLSAVVLVTFVLCFAPNNLVLLSHALIQLAGRASNVYVAYRLTLAFSSLNTCFNPIVFYIMSSELQARVLGALRLCRWWQRPSLGRPELLCESSGTGREDSGVLQDAPSPGDPAATSTMASSSV